MIRNRLKHFAERALIDSGIEKFVRQHHREGGLVLAYHNVLAEGERSTGDCSLHLGFRDFTSQLDLLEESHSVVPLHTLLDATAIHPADAEKPRVAITFDDAYSGALDIGIPELARREMPATVFVSPALLGSATWWDMLADPVLGVVNEEERDHALNDLAGKRHAVLRWAEVSGNSTFDVFSLPRIATEEELTAAAAYPGVTLASHTWSHPSLDKLPAEEIHAELTRALEWLNERYQGVMPWLSYPYGRFNSVVASIAQQAGYSAGLRVEGGWLSQRHLEHPYQIPRFNVPAGISLEGFRIRVAGFVRLA